MKPIVTVTLCLCNRGPLKLPEIKCPAALLCSTVFWLFEALALYRISFGFSRAPQNSPNCIGSIWDCSMLDGFDILHWFGCS